MSGSNGAHPDPTGLVGAFDFAKWRRLTELARDESRKRLAQAEAAMAEARGAIEARRREIAVLDKALALRPEALPKGPLGRGTRPGGGVGKRAAVFLLEVITQRYHQSGDASFSTTLARLAAKNWPPKTVQDGLSRLVEDGFVERVGFGQYRLTALGLEQPPAAPGTLPLLPPKEPEPEEVSP